MEKWLVACLCAEWCGACREWRAVFDAAAAAGVPGVRYAWIDIEDHPDVMGDIEVESFPTVLIASEAAVAFFGAIAPHGNTLRDLVRRAMRGDLGPVRDEALRAVAARARAL